MPWSWGACHVPAAAPSSLPTPQSSHSHQPLSCLLPLLLLLLLCGSPLLRRSCPCAFECSAPQNSLRRRLGSTPWAVACSRMERVTYGMVPCPALRKTYRVRCASRTVQDRSLLRVCLTVEGRVRGLRGRRRLAPGALVLGLQSAQTCKTTINWADPSSQCSACPASAAGPAQGFMKHANCHRYALPQAILPASAPPTAGGAGGGAL